MSTFDKVVVNWLNGSADHLPSTTKAILLNNISDNINLYRKIGVCSNHNSAQVSTDESEGLTTDDSLKSPEQTQMGQPCHAAGQGQTSEHDAVAAQQPAKVTAGEANSATAQEAELVSIQSEYNIRQIVNDMGNAISQDQEGLYKIPEEPVETPCEAAPEAAAPEEPAEAPCEAAPEVVPGAAENASAAAVPEAPVDSAELVEAHGMHTQVQHVSHPVSHLASKKVSHGSNVARNPFCIPADNIDFSLSDKVERALCRLNENHDGALFDPLESTQQQQHEHRREQIGHSIAQVNTDHNAAAHAEVTQETGAAPHEVVEEHVVAAVENTSEAVASEAAPASDRPPCEECVPEVAAQA